MTIRRASSAITAGLLTCGLVAIALGRGSAQQASALPEKGGPITLVGCFLHMEVAGHGEKFVLVTPMLGPATSVTEATCTSTGTQIVELDDMNRMLKVDRSKVGRWIEVNGRLAEGHHAVRELHLNTYRFVPVVAPRVAEAAPAAPTPETIQPHPAPAPAPVSETTPTATTGVAEPLPSTASSLPLIGLIGFLALTGGLGLRLIDYRRTL